MALDVDAARKALAQPGLRRCSVSTPTRGAAAVCQIVDAHMTDAIRRVLSLAGDDPRRLDLVAFGGMGAVHATAQAATLGMQRVLVPEAAPGFSALGLLTADHVVDNTRTIIADWREVDVEVLTRLGDDLETLAMAKLELAGVDPSRRRYEWLLNLVYPGQTFDVAIPVQREPGTPFTRGRWPRPPRSSITATRLPD